jgi:shikimate dehydrogenase
MRWPMLFGDPARAHTRYWDDLPNIGSYDLIVNATSAGVLVCRCSCRSRWSVPVRFATTCPMAWPPAAFLAWAKTAGARYALDGLGMLVETAADAFELWHGKRPDTEPVYQSLRQQYG